MSLLMVSLLTDGLILLVNFPALVKNEKKPFVLVQTPRTRMDVRAPVGGGGGPRVRRSLLIGQEAQLGHAQPCAGGRGRRAQGAQSCVGGGLDSQSARACVWCEFPRKYAWVGKWVICTRP